MNGTHALSAALFAMLKPGDTLLSATGLPYDTLRNAIGIEGDCHGSLKFYGINYAQVDLKADGSPDIGAIKKRRRIKASRPCSSSAPAATETDPHFPQSKSAR